jgi:hypothetical protein
MIRGRLSALYDRLRDRFDGCTAAPDFDFGETCCARHDFDYMTHVTSRAKADARLRKCITKTGRPVLAWVYWGAVRVAGRFFWRRHKGMRFERG